MAVTGNLYILVRNGLMVGGYEGALLVWAMNKGQAEHLARRHAQGRSGENLDCIGRVMSLMEPVDVETVAHGYDAIAEITLDRLTLPSLVWNDDTR